MIQVEYKGRIMKILHLFHDLMNLYGEYANTLALQKALSEKGRAAEIEKLSIDDTFDFSDFDLIYIGSGTEKNQKVALEYLRPYAEQLKTALNEGKLILATGNSFEMFGEKITDRNGKEYEGLKLFGFTVTEGTERIVEDVTAEFEENKVIGFINKASKIEGVEKPLFVIKQGVGNSDRSANVEGIRHGGFYGTHIIGPLLMRNKCMADYFAQQLIER